MSTNNRNHSFSLQPKASEIINMVKDQKKSGFVSDAIVEKFQRDKDERDSKEKLSQFPGSGEIPHDEANDVPKVGVLRGIFHRICSFRL